MHKTRFSRLWSVKTKFVHGLCSAALVCSFFTSTSPVFAEECGDCEEPNPDWTPRGSEPKCIPLPNDCWVLIEKGEEHDDSECPDCTGQSCPSKRWQIKTYVAEKSCSGFASYRTETVIFRRDTFCRHSGLDLKELIAITASLQASCTAKCLLISTSQLIALVGDCVTSKLRGEDCTGGAEWGAACTDCVQDLIDACRIISGCEVDSAVPPFQPPPVPTAVGEGTCP